MLGLVSQLWNQNPIIFLMVVGLVLFGIYAATAPLRERDEDDTPVAAEVDESVYPVG